MRGLEEITIACPHKTFLHPSSPMTLLVILYFHDDHSLLGTPPYCDTPPYTPLIVSLTRFNLSVPSYLILAV